MNVVKLVPIKEIVKRKDKTWNVQDIVSKTNEIVRFLNGMKVTVALTDGGRDDDEGFKLDTDTFSRFGEWLPKDLVK